MVYSWQAPGGPPGMAPALVREVHARAVAALRAPATLERLEGLGFEVVGSTPDEFAAFQAGEIARWRRVVQTGGITPD